MRKYINHPADGYDALLERRYIEIRKEGFDDVKTVAESTGLSAQDIIDMQKHIFFVFVQ